MILLNLLNWMFFFLLQFAWHIARKSCEELEQFMESDGTIIPKYVSTEMLHTYVSDE